MCIFSFMFSFVAFTRIFYNFSENFAKNYVISIENFVKFLKSSSILFSQNF